VTARSRKLFDDFAETFWLLPALIVLAAGLAALTFVKLDRSGIIRVGYSMAGYTTAE
jgi:uncharacterized membrane protein